MLKLREVALAVLAKFTAFTTFTELSIVRMLDRRTNGRAVKQSLWQNIAFDGKEMSKFLSELLCSVVFSVTEFLK